MTNQETINELKDQARSDPIVMNADMQPVSYPKSLPIRLLNIQGQMVAVGFTVDLMSSMTAEHLSIAAMAHRGEVSEAVIQEVLSLAFGDKANQTKTFRLRPDGPRQFVLIHNRPLNSDF